MSQAFSVVLFKDIPPDGKRSEMRTVVMAGSWDEAKEKALALWPQFTVHETLSAEANQLRSAQNELASW